MPPLATRLAAEAIGTAFLLATIVGSGIMGERLSEGNAAIALLANSLATGFALYALIVTLAPISGAHFNPLVSASLAWQREMTWRDAWKYAAVQVPAAFAGVAAAHLMFAEPLLSASTKIRAGPSQWWSEVVATFGLVLIVGICARLRLAAAPAAVATYIAAAYWFTASTSFANPAVTLARAASNTFAGIQPYDVPAFVAAQIVGAALATLLARVLSAR